MENVTQKKRKVNRRSDKNRWKRDWRSSEPTCPAVSWGHNQLFTWCGSRRYLQCNPLSAQSGSSRQPCRFLQAKTADNLRRSWVNRSSLAEITLWNSNQPALSTQTKFRRRSIDWNVPCRCFSSESGRHNRGTLGSQGQFKYSQWA